MRPAIPPLRGHGKPVDQRLPRHVPAERARLLSTIGKLGQPQRVPFDLPRLQVIESVCNACGLCAKFCPTGALRFQSDETRFALVFIPAACVDCAASAGGVALGCERRVDRGPRPRVHQRLGRRRSGESRTRTLAGLPGRAGGGGGAQEATGREPARASGNPLQPARPADQSGSARRRSAGAGAMPAHLP
ncbi:MAG: 4Fe-4S binding protein [Chloroflexi bacterium]|nr:4Fe-4S binding protein [Chloroflexota bacterium]